MLLLLAIRDFWLLQNPPETLLQDQYMSAAEVCDCDAVAAAAAAAAWSVKRFVRKPSSTPPLTLSCSCSYSCVRGRVCVCGWVGGWVGGCIQLQALRRTRGRLPQATIDYLPPSQELLQAVLFLIAYLQADQDLLDALSIGAWLAVWCGASCDARLCLVLRFVSSRRRGVDDGARRPIRWQL